MCVAILYYANWGGQNFRGGAVVKNVGYKKQRCQSSEQIFFVLARALETFWGVHCSRK